MAIPVGDEQEVVIAALALCGPVAQHSETQFSLWLPQMRATAEQVSQVLYVSVGTWEGNAAGTQEPEVSQSETRFQKGYRIL